MLIEASCTSYASKRSKIDIILLRSLPKNINRIYLTGGGVASTSPGA
jgi:hypothetical protein